MNCTEFHDLMQRRLDGEVASESGGIAAHAAGCPHCRAWLATLRRLETGLQSLTRPIPPAEMTEDIVAGVLADQRAVRRRRFVVRSAVAIAAAVLVAVLIGQRLNQPQPKGPDGSGLAEVPPNPPPAPEPTPGTPSLRESVNSVAQLTLHGADETVRSFLPEAPAKGPSPSPLTSSVASLREAGNSVTTGLEPVTGSARRALNLFLLEFPPTRTQEKRGS
jgi:hypothetical protein